MFGRIEIKNGAVLTARTSYKIDQISVVSCVRPFLIPGIMTGVFAAGFGFAFSDLLYEDEILALAGFAVMAVITGLSIGQLKFLSHDLRGSELSSAVYGFYGHLNKQRRAIFSSLEKKGE